MNANLELENHPGRAIQAEFPRSQSDSDARLLSKLGKQPVLKVSMKARCLLDTSNFY